MAIQIKKNKNANKAVHKLNEQSLNNKNRKSKAEKSPIFSQLTKYSKNVLVSAKNLSLEVIGEYVPNAKDIADDIKNNAKESLENVKKTAGPIINYAKKSLNKAEGNSLNEKLSNTIKKNKEDILQRLKSGKFYKSQDELAAEGSSDMFDDDFGDFDFGGDDYGDYDYSEDGATYTETSGDDILPAEPFTGITHGQSLITNVTAKNKKRYKSSKKSSRSSGRTSAAARGIGEYRLGDEMISSSIIDIGNSLLEQNETIWARNFAANEQRTATIVSYENHILTGVNALVEFNNNIISEVAKSTIEYHEKSLAAHQDTIDLLRELKDALLVTSTYKTREVKKSEYLNGKNLGKDYYKQISENINYVLEDYGLGGIGDMLSMATDALEMSSDLGMKMDPISALLKTGVKSLASNVNKGKFKLLNDRLENFGSSFIGKMNELSKYGNGIGSVLGKLLGVKEKPIRKSNNMGVHDINEVVGWTSKSDRTLNEVIPTYLRKILAATSGQDEILYDYSTGRMTSASGIRKQIAEKQKLASTNDTIKQYNLRIASIGSNSLFSTDEFKKKMMTAVKTGEVGSEEEYREKVSKNAKKNIDGIVEACVRTGIPFNSARAAMNDFNNEYVETLTRDLDGSKQEKRTALIMLCEAFNKMSKQEQNNFNGGIIRAFTETQNNYNTLQDDMMSKGFGSLYTEVSLDDEIKELQKSLSRDRSLNMEGTYTRGKGGRLQIKRMENSIERLKELQLLEYSRGAKSEPKAVGNFTIENGSGSSSIPGTVNNIFKLLVEGIPVYNIPLTNGLPSHLQELRKALNTPKEEKIDFSEEEKLSELYKSISEAKFKEKNRVYFEGDSIGSALFDRFRNNKFNRLLGKGIDGSIALYDMLLGQAGSYGNGIFAEDSVMAQEKERKQGQIKTIDSTIEQIKESDWQKYISEKNSKGKMTPEQIARAKKKFDTDYDFEEKHKRKYKILSKLREGLENDLEDFSDDNFNNNKFARENGGFSKLSDFSDTYINDYYSLQNSYSNTRKGYRTRGSFYYGQKANTRIRKENTPRSGLSEQYDKMYRTRSTELVNIINTSLNNPRLKNTPKKAILNKCGNDLLLKSAFEEAIKQNYIQEYLDGNRDGKSKTQLIRKVKEILLNKIKDLETERSGSTGSTAGAESLNTDGDIPNALRMPNFSSEIDNIKSKSKDLRDLIKEKGSGAIAGVKSSKLASNVKKLTKAFKNDPKEAIKIIQSMSVEEIKELENSELAKTVLSKSKDLRDLIKEKGSGAIANVKNKYKNKNKNKNNDDDIPKFASGGIVPDDDSRISGFADKILTRQNPGEMNLNKRQQKNLFGFISRLDGGMSAKLSINKGMTSNDKLSAIITGSTDEKAVKSTKKAGIGAGIFTLLSQINHTMASTLKLLGGNDKGELDEKNEETIAGQLNGISAGGGGDGKGDKKGGWFNPGLLMLGIQAAGAIGSAIGIGKRFKHEGAVSGMGSLTGLEDEANSLYNADGTKKSDFQVMGDRITRETRRGIIMGGEKEIVKNAGKGLKNTQIASLGKKMISGSKRIYTAFSKGGAKGGFKAIHRMSKQAAKSTLDSVAKSFKTNIVNFFTNSKVLSKLKISEKIAKKLGVEIGERAATNVARETTKAAGKKGILGALKSVPIGGWIFAAADILWQIAEGYNLAGRYFDVSPEDVTPTMRTVSMVVKGVKALIVNLLSISGLGIAIGIGIELIIPDKWLVEKIYNIVSSKEEKEARDEAQRRQKEAAEEMGITAEGLSEAQNHSTFTKMTTGIQTFGSKLFGKGKSYKQISDEKTLKKINKQRKASNLDELSYDEYKSKDSIRYKSSILNKIRSLKADSPISEFNSIKENFDNLIASGNVDSIKEVMEAAKEKDIDLPPLTNDINTLTPAFRKKWEALLNDPEIIAAEINPKVNGARRPLATQFALYTKGRADPSVLDIAAKAAGFKEGKNFWADQTKKVTWTLKSNHLGGNALDIDTRNLSKEQLELLGRKAKEYGIEWGGFWHRQRKDEPHFEDAKPVQSFSRGGIVSGKRDMLYGDKVKARLNPKEMVLNETQQAGLFSLIKSAENKLMSSGQSIRATFKNPFIKDTEMTNEMIDKALLIQSKIYEEQKRHNNIAEKFFEALIKMIATSMNTPNPNIGYGNRRNTEESFSDSLIAGAKAIAAGL